MKKEPLPQALKDALKAYFHVISGSAKKEGFAKNKP